MARTFVLPSLTNAGSQAIRVGGATTVPYEVVMRVLGPPGEWAVFSFDSPNELNLVAPVQRLVVGNTLTIASGDHQTIHLRPHQSIYAKGSVGPDVLDSEGNPRPPVCISVTLTESVV